MEVYTQDIWVPSMKVTGDGARMDRCARGFILCGDEVKGDEYCTEYD